MKVIKGGTWDGWKGHDPEPRSVMLCDTEIPLSFVVSQLFLTFGFLYPISRLSIYKHGP